MPWGSGSEFLIAPLIKVHPAGATAREPSTLLAPNKHQDANPRFGVRGHSKPAPPIALAASACARRAQTVRKKSCFFYNLQQRGSCNVMAENRGFSAFTRPSLAFTWRAPGYLMAERVGFEPTRRLPVYTASNRAHSAALTPLRGSSMSTAPWRRSISWTSLSVFSMRARLSS